MSFYEIPLEPDSYYDFTVALESFEWRITVRWNRQIESWYMDLVGISVPGIILKGIKLAGGVDLLQPHAVIELGALYLVDLEGDNEDPDFENFGTRFLLVYGDKTEASIFG